MTWAGTSGTPPCTGSAISGTSITSAQYTTTYGYDTLDRLTSGASGSYTYGDAAHLHAATAIGATYSASYDAAGNMTCRAPSGSVTCTGSSPTGAQLGYDTEGRLVTWLSAPTNPTTTAKYLYDGEGQRVESQVSVSGTTTTTVYAGGLEEVATTGATTTSTSYYDLGGAGFGVSINGAAPSYLATDHLGSPAVTLDGSGNLTGSQLYAAYGTSAYTSGSMPGSYGYTGQHSDVATTGLDYYGARSYDPVAGQFTTADTVRDGQSRFGYVAGNPETHTDPSGHECMTGPPDCGGVATEAPGGSAGGGDVDPTDPSRGPGTTPQAPSAPSSAPIPCGWLAPFCAIGAGWYAVTHWLAGSPAGPAASDGWQPDPIRQGVHFVPLEEDGPDPLHQGVHFIPGATPTPGTPTTPTPVPAPGGGGGPGAGAPPSTAANPDPCDKGTPGYTYQTYTVTHQTGQVYSGRAGGPDAPDVNIRERFNGGGLGTHPTKLEPGWGEPVLDKSGDYMSIRGREQQLIDYYRSQGLGNKNIRNGAGPRNKCRGAYLKAATAAFGEITSDPRLVLSPVCS